MKTVANFIKDSKIFYLATNSEGTPDVRPMGISLVHDEKIYFIAAKPMNLVKQLSADQKISISAYNGDKFLRLYGNAILDDSAKTIKALYAMNEEAKKMFPEAVIAPYYLSDVKASICSFSEAAETHNF